MTPRVEAAAATDAGRVRAENEDSVAVDTEHGYAVLADGMGGYQAGEVASRIAVDVVSAELKRALAEHAVEASYAERLLAQAVAAANSAIFNAAQTRADCAGMGTTLVVALWFDEHVTVAHAGDSRLYRLRGDALLQLTRDHSLAQEQIDRGVLTPAQARYSANRAVVTRAVGIDGQVESDVRTFEVAAADLYLLCSDGLTDMLSDVEIERVLTSRPPELQRAAHALVAEANAKGGRDNISVILVRVHGSGAPA